MRAVVALAGAIVAVGSVLGSVAPASASVDEFRGSWESIDPGDGSSQTLRIQGSGTAGKHAVFLYDAEASVACGGAPANVAGSGTVVAVTLTWFFTVTCPGSGQPPLRGLVGPGFFTYNAGDDTLVDDAGAIWHRL